jgi:hypothetical protein
MDFLDPGGAPVRYAQMRSSARSAAPILPPPLPVSATTRMPSSCAAWIASTTFAELPLVEIASNASPRRPMARSGLENTC